MRYMLVGNFGVGNVGDEAIREYHLMHFPEVQWTVVTARGDGPGEVPPLPCGLRSLFRPWWRTAWAMRSSDGVVFGGGSLFTDTESLWACVIWWWQAFIAHVLNRRIFLAFQGIGPFRTRAGERLTTWVLRRSTYISVRDPVSLERATQLLGTVNKNIILSFDPVLSVKSAYKAESAQDLLIIPRGNSTPDFFAEVERMVSRHWSAVRLMVLDPKDAEVAECLRAQHGQGSIEVIRNYRQLLEAVSKAAMVVTQRYHGAIAALALGVPFRAIAQKPGDKLASISPVNLTECFARMTEGEQSLRAALVTV